MLFGIFTSQTVLRIRKNEIKTEPGEVSAETKLPGDRAIFRHDSTNKQQLFVLLIEDECVCDYVNNVEVFNTSTHSIVSESSNDPMASFRS